MSRSPSPKSAVKEIKYWMEIHRQLGMIDHFTIDTEEIGFAGTGFKNNARINITVNDESVPYRITSSSQASDHIDLLKAQAWQTCEEKDIPFEKVLRANYSISLADLWHSRHSLSLGEIGNTLMMVGDGILLNNDQRPSIVPEMDKVNAMLHRLQDVGAIQEFSTYTDYCTGGPKTDYRLEGRLCIQIDDKGGYYLTSPEETNAYMDKLQQQLLDRYAELGLPRNSFELGDLGMTAQPAGQAAER